MLALRWILAVVLIPSTFAVQADALKYERTGRLVDEAGMPIQFRPVSLVAIWAEADEEMAEGIPGSRLLGKASTKADGSFVMRLHDLPTASERKRCVFDLAVDEDDAKYARYVRLYEDIDLQPGPRDLGQRVAERSVPMAAGQVVDDRGEVVTSAQVHVVHRLVRAEHSSPATWTLDEHLFDGRGNFELQWSLTPKFVALQAFAVDHLPSPVVWVKNGAHDVRLEVTRFGSIDGHVLIDDVVARAKIPIWVDVAPPDDADHALWQPSAYLDGLEFHRGPLAPGRWALRAGFERASNALTVPIDVHAANGTQPITVDLRGKLPVRYLDLVDEAGSRITTQPMFEPVPCGKTLLVSGEPRSMLALVGPGEFDDFWVGADGYRLQHLGPGQGDQRVVLHLGLRATFHLPAGLQLPPKPWRLAFAVDPLVEIDPNHVFTPGDLYSWSKTFAFDAAGDVTLILPNWGKCDVSWSLLNGDERRRLVPTRIEIPPRNDPQRIEIQPDAKDYAAALEKLKAR